jgi:hypothetical protein
MNKIHNFSGKLFLPSGKDFEYYVGDNKAIPHNISKILLDICENSLTGHVRILINYKKKNRDYDIEGVLNMCKDSYGVKDFIVEYDDGTDEIFELGKLLFDTIGEIVEIEIQDIDYRERKK